MPERLMNFEKDIEPCQKQSDVKNLEISIKQQKKKNIQKIPASIKFTKVIK